MASGWMGSFYPLRLNQPRSLATAAVMCRRSHIQRPLADGVRVSGFQDERPESGEGQPLCLCRAFNRGMEVFGIRAVLPLPFLS
jgi:hypothetical protein